MIVSSFVATAWIMGNFQLNTPQSCLHPRQDVNKTASRLNSCCLSTVKPIRHWRYDRSPQVLFLIRLCNFSILIDQPAGLNFQAQENRLISPDDVCTICTGRAGHKTSQNSGLCYSVPKPPIILNHF